MKKVPTSFLIVATIIAIGIVFVVCFKILFHLPGENFHNVTCGTCEKEMQQGQWIDHVTDTTSCDGKKLFNKCCASCHNASPVMSTGPGLQGVLDRIPSRDWAYKWVENYIALLKSGDAYANKIFEQYNKTPHTVYADILTHKDIDAILDYADAGRCK